MSSPPILPDNIIVPSPLHCLWLFASNGPTGQAEGRGGEGMGEGGRGKRPDQSQPIKRLALPPPSLLSFLPYPGLILAIAADTSRSRS